MSGMLSKFSNNHDHSENFCPMPSENLATISIEDDALNDDEYSSNRLFVSNFPFSWTEKELRDFMKEFEPVAEVEIVYNERGSKGFGFVTINDVDRCLSARMALNHKIVHGRRVEVRRAHKHKRARNTGPQPANSQNAAATPAILQSLQNLQNMALLSSFPQLQFQAALTPSLLNILQNPLLAQTALQQSLAMNLPGTLPNLPAHFVGQAPGMVDPLRASAMNPQLSSIYALRAQELAAMNGNGLGLGSGGCPIVSANEQLQSPTLSSTTASTYSLFGESNGMGSTNDLIKNVQNGMNPYVSQTNSAFGDVTYTPRKSTYLADRSNSTPDMSHWLNEGRRMYSDIAAMPDGAAKLEPFTH